jgi:MoaA/NifB/PqqE/SkfB family radical SAM enzyme
MQASEVVKAWGGILMGRVPSMSIEVTRECPLRCPGCYAYEDAHLGTGVNLRQLSDYKGDDLVNGVLSLVRRHRPLHVSLVGGDPLVRYREMETVIPKITAMGTHVQLVTSAFREIPEAWATTPKLNVVVSIDGLQPEHDVRRKPATYERILKSIAKAKVTVHCTITSNMRRPGYLEEFVKFWSEQPQVRKIWFSTLTPQKGELLAETPSAEQRKIAIHELMRLRPLYPKLDMNDATLREYLNPPQSPEECIFARTTKTYSADFKTSITPCQFGGNPDCSQCGCIASMGLAALGHHKLAGIPLGQIFNISTKIGSGVAKLTAPAAASL